MMFITLFTVFFLEVFFFTEVCVSISTLLAIPIAFPTVCEVEVFRFLFKLGIFLMTL